MLRLAGGAVGEGVQHRQKGFGGYRWKGQRKVGRETEKGLDNSLPGLANRKLGYASSYVIGIRTVVRSLYLKCTLSRETCSTRSPTLLRSIPFYISLSLSLSLSLSVSLTLSLSHPSPSSPLPRASMNLCNAHRL